MAAPHGQLPWNNAEKVLTAMANLVPPRKLTTSSQIVLLAEIIKQHAPTPDHLLPIVNNFLGPQQPSWNDIIPPPG
jgi:hypothetical protein